MNLTTGIHRAPARSVFSIAPNCTTPTVPRVSQGVLPQGFLLGDIGLWPFTKRFGGQRDARMLILKRSRTARPSMVSLRIAVLSAAVTLGQAVLAFELRPRLERLPCRPQNDPDISRAFAQSSPRDIGSVKRVCRKLGRINDACFQSLTPPVFIGSSPPELTIRQRIPTRCLTTRVKLPRSLLTSM